MRKGTIDGTSCSLVVNIIALPSTCDTLASSHWPSHTSGPAHLKGTTIPCAFLHFCTHLVSSIFSTVLLFLKPVLSLELPVHRGWPYFVDFQCWVVQFQNSMISQTRVQNGVHWGTHSFFLCNNVETGNRGGSVFIRYGLPSSLVFLVTNRNC